jgi:hypothetical protein
MRIAPFTTAFTLVFALLLPVGSAHATTIYRCTDANGNVTMQNDTPCAPGMKQEVRTIGEVPTAPAPARRPAEAPVQSGPPPGAQFELVRGPVDSVLPATRVPEAERKPPPPLFQCRTWDEDSYVTESETPQARCAVLNTVGIDGTSAMGAGQACEMKTDTCVALDGPALCQAWQRRIDEAKFRMTFAPDADKAARTAEYERQLAAYVDTSCRTRE